jgi:hypothetical protein
MGASAWLQHLISRVVGPLGIPTGWTYWVVPVRKICSGLEAMTR